MKLPFLLLLLLFFGCIEQPDNSKSKKAAVNGKQDIKLPEVAQQENDSISKNLQILKLDQPTQKYEVVKRAIERERRQLHLKDLTSNSLSKIFERSLLNRIIPFWEGTPWSFEGHTAIPQIGTIACGYFVSTTLQDIGLHLNRYKLAQQNPINEAKSLAISTEVKIFSEASNLQNIAAINNYLQAGIHFIGFDQSHVGYIMKKDGRLYLIHSNYINAKGVEMEPIEQSEVFSAYNKFYIVELSTNEDLLKNWITREKVHIITGD